MDFSKTPLRGKNEGGNADFSEKKKRGETDLSTGSKVFLSKASFLWFLLLVLSLTADWVPSAKGSSVIDDTQKVIQKYNLGDTLQFTCKDFDRLTDCKIKWGGVPKGEGLPLNTEMKRGLIWLKEK